MITSSKNGERRVSPSLYRVLLTSHIVVSVGWLGVVLAKVVLGALALTAGAPESAAALATAMWRLNVAFPPVAIGTIVTGVLLSLGTKWGLIQHYWVATKLALTVGVIVTAVRLGDRFVQQSTGASLAQAPTSGTLLDISSSGIALLLALAATHLVMLVVATVLSVYKPWGKTWFGRRKAQRSSPPTRALPTALPR
jgi:hypothetical protein